MRRSRDEASVLVTDVEERSSLAACRGLAQAGYRVTGVAGMRPAPGHWSRSCHRRVCLPDPRTDPDSFLAGLHGVLEQDEHAIVLPSTDVSTWLISEHREHLDGLARLAISGRAAVRRSLDKGWLIESAPAADLAPPTSTLCASPEEGIYAAARIGFPVVVKAARSFVSHGRGFKQKPVTIATSEATLRDALFDVGSSFIVQRYETRGRVLACSGVMTPSGLLALAVVRWRRRWPPESGAASYCETIVPPAELVARIERLLTLLRFQGIFELELLELDGGRLAAIDLNPRLFGWMSLALGAGANLPALLCDWLRGQDPDPVQAVPGIRYRWEDGDLRHLAWQLRRGHAVAAAAVLRPRKRVVHPHFELADPAPLAARLGYLAHSWLRHRRERTSQAALTRRQPHHEAVSP
jgi:carbamoyl-phosphate synthase large subunit